MCRIEIENTIYLKPYITVCVCVLALTCKIHNINNISLLNIFRYGSICQIYSNSSMMVGKVNLEFEIFEN